MSRQDRWTDEHFREQLLSIMDRKNHWAWTRFSGPKISKAQLKIHYQQEYAVYVRDFPIFLGRLYSKTPSAEARRPLATNLYEEETGGLSLGKPHPALFLKMMEALGLQENHFQRISLLPASRRYRRWLDEVTLSPSWLEGTAVITIFVEGSIHDRKEIGDNPPAAPPIEEVLRNHFLVRHHQLDPSALDLIRAHYLVEHGHRLDAWQIVLQNATSRASRKRVYDHLHRSLDLWLAYREGVAKEAGIRPS
ncbi:MAG: iron-containing redox enzyme family protein [Candidatus Manganitrophus sp.]|nr:MAG: iron-containing redox enzyme family protein [Candidatus Manganitrophus sp.]